MSSNSTAACYRVIIDIAMLILVAIPSLVFKVANIQPTQRGFFCDDQSIRYPYHPSTISTVTLIMVGGFTNVITILVCEGVHYYRRSKTTSVSPEKVGKFTVNKYIYIIVGYIWVLGFGILFTQGITDVGKWTIGRLRPHFIDGCKPSIDLSKCVVGQYISNFTCLQDDPEIFHDLRLSFPSGHASMAAFAMTFLVLYIQQRIPRFPVSYLFKHVLQFIAVLMGWFCGLSRVMDYKHHWSDVLTGYIIGILVALFSVRYISKAFRNPYTNGPYPRSEFMFHQSMTLYSVNDNGNNSNKQCNTESDVEATAPKQTDI